MKEYKISLRDGETAYVKGTVHNLILKNGEKIKVIAHRPYKGEEKYWCITDLESGYQLCGTTEYKTFFYGDLSDRVYTKEKALFYAVYKLNIMVVDKGKTFAEFRDERIKSIEGNR